MLARPADVDWKELARLRHIADQASLVVAALGRAPSLASSPDVVLGAAAGTVAAAVSETMRALNEWSWTSGAGGARRLEASRSQLVALSWRLRGLADAAMMDLGPPLLEPVVTLPAGTGGLRNVLGDKLGMHATRDGFAHVAANARVRLIFLIPFMDNFGAEMLVRLLHATSAPERLVVVRPDSRGNRWFMTHLPALRAANARVVEYWRAPDGESVPGQRPETFHAKLAVADNELVYVGSSNFMVSSLDESLECGVLVRGETARAFATLADAVVTVSSPCPGGD